MKNWSYLPLVALLALLTTSCARVYQSADAPAVVTEHRRVALLPPAVTIQNRVQLGNGKTTETLETETAEELQRALFTWMLDRQMDGDFQHVTVQDPQSTNAKLRQLGYFENKDLGNEWLAQMLGVDAIITADFRLDHLLAPEAAVAISILTDNVPIPSRQGAVWLRLYDRDADRVIWSYNRHLSRSYAQQPEAIINGVMRHASKKMPYRQKS